MNLRPGNSNRTATQMRISLKLIAAWLGISEATLFRWLRIGLIDQLPQSPQDAQALRSRIDKAKETAYLRRAPNQKGRTPLPEIAVRIQERCK